MSPPSDHDEARPRPGRTERGATPPGDHLRITLAAEMSVPSIVRERLDAWLSALRWPAGQQDDLVLAVSEAVSNSVEHGYRVDHTSTGRPGAVEVDAVVHTAADGYRHLVITVRDEGTWRPPGAERGNRRHGLPLMGACVETLEVDGTEHGTTVVLRSRPVPPPLLRD